MTARRASPSRRALSVAITLALAVAVPVGAPVSRVLASGASAPPVSADPTVLAGHMRLRLDGRLLSVEEIYQMTNSGGTKAERVEFALPASYTGLTLLSGVAEGDVVVTGSGFYDKRGLEPGETRTYRFSYSREIPGEGLAVRWRALYPTDVLVVLAPEKGLAVSGPGLTDGGPAEVGAENYRQYTAHELPAGAELEFKVALGETTGSAPLPLLNKSFHGGNANVMLWKRFTGSPGHGGATGVVLFIGLLSAGIWLSTALAKRRATSRREVEVQRRGGPGRAVPGRAGRTATPPDQETLLSRKTEMARRIAELDRRYGAGEVPEETYTRLRSGYKSQLAEVVLALKRLEVTGSDTATRPRAGSGPSGR